MPKTVKVHLKNMWFAPTTTFQKSKLQSMSGRRFKPGIYEWPESVIPHLPKTAEVLNPDAIEAENPFDGAAFEGHRPTDLEDERYTLDHLGAAADEAQRIENEADKNDTLTKKTDTEILEERKANLAKANAAREAKAKAAAQERERERAAAAQAPDPEADEAPAVDGGEADSLEF